MGVAMGRRRLGVPKELVDEREPETGTRADAGEGVAQVMDPKVLESRALPGRRRPSQGRVTPRSELAAAAERDLEDIFFEVRESPVLADLGGISGLGES